MNKAKIVLILDKRRINADKQTTGVAQPGNRNEQIKKQNTRTLLGYRQNCAGKETEWETKIIQQEVKHA